MSEALCPGCGKLPTSMPITGWLFYCKPCDWGWGHSQLMSRDEARRELRKARTPATQAFLADRALDTKQGGAT